jgi:hypothetical protein
MARYHTMEIKHKDATIHIDPSKGDPSIMSDTNILTLCWHNTTGPAFISPNLNQWYVNDKVCNSNQEYQNAANLNDMQMTYLILKYGNISNNL